MRPERSLLARIAGQIIRLRAEILVAAVLVTTWVLLTRHLPSWGAAAGMLTAALFVFAVPASRQYVTRRVWCVLSRHCVRAGLLKSRVPTMTFDGKLPYLLWSRPSPIGDRIRVWLPAGLAVKDIERATDALAVACWARSVRILPVRGHAALVILDVVRRDPLAGAEPVPSDATGDLPEHAHGEPARLIPLPRRDTTVPAG